MINTKKVIICVLLLFCFVFTSGCVPSTNFFDKREQGMYPTTADFPNTKWICRELDMALNAFELAEFMVGSYKVNSESYHAVVSFEFEQIEITFYSSADVSKSENSNSIVHCEPIVCGYIYGTYFFDEETKTILCSISNSISVDEETIPQELTLEKVGVIQLEQEYRWHAQELDMYLDSFLGVDGYYRGEIILEEKKIYINAFEIIDNYYLFSIENGDWNNLKPGTVSPLIYMYFQIGNDKITARVCDKYLSEQHSFPYWRYEDMIITFTPTPNSKN